jgi:hypothetical protein
MPKPTLWQHPDPVHKDEKGLNNLLTVVGNLHRPIVVDVMGRIRDEKFRNQINNVQVNCAPINIFSEKLHSYYT